MKKIKLFVAALGLLGAMTASAQTDVTATLANAGFNPEAEPLGWTWDNSSMYFDHGMGLIGTYQVRGEHPAATVDETHLNTEFCLGLECRWSTNYSAATQTVTLPEGVYRVSYDVENTNGTTTKATYQNRFTVTVGETVYTDTNIEWMNGKSAWTTHTIDFTLNEETAVTFSFGYGTGSNNFGVGNTPALYVSHLSLTHQSLLDGVKALWEEAHQAAVDAKADEAYANVTGEELAALEAEIAKAEPTTQEGYEQATADLNDAVSAFKGAKDAYDGLATLWNNGVPELIYATTAKYTAIGDAYFGEGDVVNADDALARIAAMQIAIRAYYESHALAENVEDAANMTSHITNPDATNGNNGWTWTGSKNDPRNTESWTDANGKDDYMYFDGGNWNGTGWTTTMSQEVTVPAGKYLLTAKGRASVNTTLTMAVGEVSVELPNIGNAGNVFNRGWGDGSVEFETDGNPFNILVTATTEGNHEWFSVGDFRLVRLELYTEMADAADYQALNDAIAVAEGKALGFEANEYAPYNNVEAIQALAAAKALDQTAENAKSEVEALTAALEDWTANAGEVNAIYDGQFANTEANTTSGDINLPGWTKVQGIRLLVKDAETDPGLAYTEGGAAVFAWGGTTLTYGEQEGYTLPLKADKTYKLSFKVSGWRDGDFPTVVSVNLDGAVQNVNASGFAPINATDVNPFVSYNVLVTPTADNSVLKIYANHHFTIADLELVEFVPEEVTLSEDDEVVFDVPELPVNVTINRPITAGEWAAVVLPFNGNVTDVFGADAQAANYVNAENNALYFETDLVEFEAGTPFLVQLNADETTFQAEKVVLSSTLNAVEYGDYAFVPAYNKTWLQAGDVYVAHENKLKEVAAGTAASIKAYRGYFHPVTSQEQVEAKVLVVDGQVTGIVSIENGQLRIENGAVYNLNGQRVTNAQRGVYIINGKKVVLK